MGWHVNIIETATGKVEHTIGPYASERQAEKAERAIINRLDTDRYHATVEATHD